MRAYHAAKAGQDGGVAWWALLNNFRWAVGLCLATKNEDLAICVHGEEMDRATGVKSYHAIAARVCGSRSCRSTGRCCGRCSGDIGAGLGGRVSLRKSSCQQRCNGKGKDREMHGDCLENP